MFKQLKKLFSSSEKKGESLYSSLAKSESSSFWKKITHLLSGSEKVNEEVLEAVEEILLSADIGFDTTTKIIQKFKPLYEQRRLEKLDSADLLIREVLYESILQFFEEIKIEDNPLQKSSSPWVIFMVGVNGTGKTTSIAKLAYSYQQENLSVLLGAGDTFRAGAVEQLDMWADRLQANIVKKEKASDPSSVVFETLKTALSKQVDIVIMDTSGRMHNNMNLMNELSKMIQTAKKIIPDAPHETYLVIDGTSGQNAIEQAKMFGQTASVSGIIVTKLDGTAKGGILLSIADTLKIPIKFIGVGEKVEDLLPFDYKQYLENLFLKT